MSTQNGKLLDRGLPGLLQGMDSGRAASDAGSVALMPEAMPEDVQTALAIAEITRTLALLPDRQIENVFHAIAAIRRTMKSDNDIDADGYWFRDRVPAPVRKWWKIF